MNIKVIKYYLKTCQCLPNSKDGNILIKNRKYKYLRLQILCFLCWAGEEDCCVSTVEMAVYLCTCVTSTDILYTITVWLAERLVGSLQGTVAHCRVNNGGREEEVRMECRKQERRGGERREEGERKERTKKEGGEKG
jgi:hypothetical protein